MRRLPRTLMSCVCVVVALAPVGAEERLVVHEWGTFTVLQDERGISITGVNINEESLPSFVHELAPELAPDSHELGPLIAYGRNNPRRSKGIERNFHAARMRMETPVIYVYPPQGKPSRPIDVQVGFKGGWITEWYPQANVSAPGYKSGRHNATLSLTPNTTGTISWKGLSTSPENDIPETKSPVWLAPRGTSAPSIGTSNGETEKYLFYRGVANLESPLRVARSEGQLTISNNQKSTCPIEDFRDIAMWLVEVTPSGDLAFRRVAASNDQPGPEETLAKTAATLDKPSSDGLPRLRAEMIDELVERGLFRDEAEAMLNTWEVSYFRTAGLRLFYTLPQSWTDRVLPLSVKGYEKQDTVRTMIGRVEMVSPRQRALIDKIKATPASDNSWYVNWLHSPAPKGKTRLQQLTSGKSLKSLGLTPPPEYVAYMQLGRFRDALIQHERLHPTQSSEYVYVDGQRMVIDHPALRSGKVDSVMVTLPGENRVLNLAGVTVEGPSGKVPVSVTHIPEPKKVPNEKHLFDNNRGTIFQVSGKPDPWVQLTMAEPTEVRKLHLWNCYWYEHQFDGAVVEFRSGAEVMASVKIDMNGANNIRDFTYTYSLLVP